MQYSILIIDDEVAILQMLGSYLDKKYAVKKAINGKTALNFIKKQTPDLILIDWMLPDISGVEIIDKIKREDLYKDIPIIMLTAKSSELDKVKAFESGADDYMVKPISLIELNARITALLRRSYKKATIINYENLSFDSEKQVFLINDKYLKTSGKEFKLLKLLIKNPQRIYTREQLISIIWQDGDANNRLVDVLISRTRKQLLDRDCSLLQTVHGLGYRLSSE
jgi:two-component system phosphate regulon response regulator PhoB